MEQLIDYKNLINAIVYSVLGLLIFTGSFVLLDILTPKVSIWKELVEKQNIAVSIFLAALMYGIATIIATAILG